MSAPDLGPGLVARDSRDDGVADGLTTGLRVGTGETKTTKEKVEKSPKKKKDKKRADEKPADDNRNYEVEVGGESADLNCCHDNRCVLLPPVSSVERRENGSDNKMAAVKSGKGKKAQKENANGNVKEDSEKKKKKKKKKKKGVNGDDESFHAGKEKEMLLKSVGKEKSETEMVEVIKEKLAEDTKIEGDLAVVVTEKPAEDRKCEGDLAEVIKKKLVGDAKSEKEPADVNKKNFIEDGKIDIKTTENLKKKLLDDDKSEAEKDAVNKKNLVEKSKTASAEVSKKKLVKDENCKTNKAKAINETETAEVINETDTTEVTGKLSKEGTSSQQQVIAASKPGVVLGIETSSACVDTGSGLKPSEIGKEVSAELSNCAEKIDNGGNTAKVNTRLSNDTAYNYTCNSTEGAKRDESLNKPGTTAEDELTEKVPDTCADNSDIGEEYCEFIIGQNSECVTDGKNHSGLLDGSKVYAGCESENRSDEDIEKDDLESAKFTMAEKTDISLDPRCHPEQSHDTLTSLPEYVSARNKPESVQRLDTPTGCATAEQVNAEEKSNITRTVLQSEPCRIQATVSSCSADNTGVDYSGADLELGTNEMDNVDEDRTTVDNFGVVKSSSLDEVQLPVAFTNTSEMTRDQLLQHLQEQHEAMTRLQDHSQEQAFKANQLTVSLRAKLRRRDQEMQLMKSEHDQQLSAVLSHLLYLEGQMQKEHNEVVELLHEKDDVIRRQRSAIEDLSNKNTRYLQALKESHGYSLDNGLVKPPVAQILPKNENVSIQDHGNKVILRDRNKAQALIHKVRFSAIKDRLRRHKSSLELSQHEPLETLIETSLKYGSEENLMMDRSVGFSPTDRKVRCRSLIENPVTASLFEEEEAQNENPDNIFDAEFSSPILSRNDSTCSLGVLSDRASRSSADLSSSVSPSYGFNELSKSRSVPHGLPTVVENDVSPTHFRGRPLSLPSVDILTKEVAASRRSETPSSSNSSINKTPVAPNLPAPTPTVTPISSSPPSESNPFKTFKNVFKRKGSSKKKRAAAVTSGQEQSDVLKQHFKKYDMT